jgi:hypothetical protein
MIQAVKVPRERIEPLRPEFLAATRFQLRYSRRTQRLTHA